MRELWSVLLSSLYSRFLAALEQQTQLIDLVKYSQVMLVFPQLVSI